MKTGVQIIIIIRKYWIPAFAGMTGQRVFRFLRNHQNPFMRGIPRIVDIPATNGANTMIRAGENP